ncbi:MAG: hypothetical protein NTW87_15190 [Planctomycetota bacterium]|nr:hypothetical protein [Planctomycetota bacterium]
MPTTDAPPKAVLDPPAAQAWSRLESRVVGVKARHRTKFLGTGLCFGLALFAAAFLGFSLADIVFKLSVGSRVFALLSTVIGVAAVFFWCVIRPWTRLGSAVQVARSVEGVYPQLEEQLSTALEYGQDPELSRKTSSPALVGALMQHTAQRAEPLDFARTIRWKEFAIAGALALVFAFCVAGYAARERRLFGVTFSRFLHPTADIAPPTLTVITRVEPEDTGNREFPVESSVPVVVDVAGRRPATATLSVFIGDSGADGRWEDRVMDRGDDNRYRATLRRLLDTTRYRVRAGDAESPEHKIEIYRIPEISEFALRLEHPAYTGRGIEVLAPGVGDVRALKGTTVHVDMKANTDLSAARITFKSGHTAAPAAVDPADPRKASAAFKVENDDDYQMNVANLKGKTGSGALYPIKALKDRPPKVTIRQPEKDLMVHRAQTVQIEIAAEDDIGVGEIGIFHSLGLDESKVMVRRLDPASPRTDGKLVWELSNLGLKGGEVISYYAYALDNDTIGGPKMAKSDIHFLTAYDEQEYDSPQNPDKKKPGAPEAVKQLDKLIDVQKKLLKETFAQARQRETNASQPVTAPEKAAAQKTAEAQGKLRDQVKELLDKVKDELERSAQQPEQQPTDNPDGPKPPKPGLGENELKHMEASIEKMGRAETELKVPDTPKAVRPESEALRHLSETRRLLLSDKEGDPRFKMAMDKQSKKKKQQQKNQQQQDQEQAKQELTELPKMMEREKQLERELEQLNERKKKNPPPQGEPQTEEQKKEQEEQRRLQREEQQELDRLAKEADERTRKLDRLASRNADMQQAADKMQQAAEKLDKAAEEAKQQPEKNTREAQQQTKEAHNDTRDAQRALRNALEKQIRQELANLQKDAQELAQRQQDLAQQAEQAQKEQQQGQPQQGQQQQPQNQQGQQPQQGQQQAQNQPGQQGAPEQRLRGMAGEQRDIRGELKDLADRIDKAGQEAAQKELGGAQALEQARQQAAENSPASQSAQKAQDAMQSAKAPDAQREAAKAAKAMEQLARTIQDAAQKTTAEDLKALAAAMKKAQGLAKEQGEINKELAAKRDSSQLGQREEQVSGAAKDVADTADKLEVLRQQGRQGATKEKLQEASKQADSAARAIKAQDPPAAKVPGEQAEKALNQAVAEMERAAGKTLEEKAREAKALARAARENQEKATAAAKEMGQPNADEKLPREGEAKRDESAAKERQASRDAKRLDQSLDGLKEMAKEANPAAADAAREARETTEKAELPKAMDDLAKGVEKIGDPKRAAENADAPKVTPQEAVKKGEQLAQVVRRVDKNLDAFVAEATNSELDRLKSMENAAREAAKKAQELAQGKPGDEGKPRPDNQQTADKPKPDPNAKADPKDGQGKANKESTADKKPDDQGKPQGKNTGQQPAPSPEAQRAEAAENLAKDVKRLEPKLQRLEANAPEIAKMREAAAELDKAREALRNEKATPEGKPAPGPRNTGGPNFQRVNKHLDDVAGGLLTRIERLLRAREIKPDEDEDAPKEYRALVDKYYRALSEDVEDEKQK